MRFDWKFVHLNHHIIKTDFASEEHSEYIAFSDTLASVPVEHEYSAIRSLKESGWCLMTQYSLMECQVIS